MKIGILETGILNDNLKSEFQPYPIMFEYLINRANTEFEYASYCVLNDEMPQSINDCDGWLITGSRHGVYENLDWMKRLQSFIREVHAADIPLVGICFGHQIIAQALGGKVEKSDKGWGVGVHQYKVTDQQSWMQETDDTVKIYAFHQDQITDKPPTATVFLESDFCPYAGLTYGDSAVSIQGHPEFEEVYESALLDLYGGSLVPEAVAGQAKSEMAQGNVAETDRLASWLGQFFQHHQAQHQA